MRIEHLCYTRGSAMDYGVFVAPTNIDKSQLNVVLCKIQSILGDGVVRNLEIPKWILYKNNSTVFWGLCCENKLLSSENKETTHKNRPIRGFFAVVITDFNLSELKVPFDINYFKDLYRTEVEPCWCQNELHYNKSYGFYAGSYNYITVKANSSLVSFNTDIFQCQSLGNVDKEYVIASALSLDNLSLLIDNDNIEQAVNSSGSFMNCLSALLPYKKYPVKQICPKCKRLVSSFTSSGLCRDCEINKHSCDMINKKDRETFAQIKMELEIARTSNVNLQNNLQVAQKQIRRSKLWVIGLSVLSIVLFILLLLSQDLTSLELFDNKPQIINDSPSTSSSGNKQRPPKKRNPHKTVTNVNDATGNFLNVGAEMQKNYRIELPSGVEDVEITAEWVVLRSFAEGYILLDIEENHSGESRTAEINLLLNGSIVNSIKIEQPCNNF